jgi:hypothetical protein
VEVLFLACPASAQRLDFLAFVFRDFIAVFLTFFTAFFAAFFTAFFAVFLAALFPAALFFLTAGIAAGAGIGAGVLIVSGANLFSSFTSSMWSPTCPILAFLSATTIATFEKLSKYGAQQALIQGALFGLFS